MLHERIYCKLVNKFTDKNTVIEVDSVGPTSHTSSTRDEIDSTGALSPIKKGQKRKKDDTGNDTTASESGAEMQSNTSTVSRKLNAFGEIKTSRYSHQEKPPLLKCIFRRKKGSIKPTRFSQRIINKQKQPNDTVRHLHIISLLTWTNTLTPS